MPDAHARNVNAAAAAGLGLGIALAGAPGPVQAVLLNEGLRGGPRRGFEAMAGANLTFGALLVGLALGISLARPSGVALRVLELVGGGFLVWLALDAFRAAWRPDESGRQPRALPPVLRGALAVVLNPGAWLFLGTAAASLFSTAQQLNGRGGAVVAALTLVAGLAMGDATVVLFGGFGLRRAGQSGRIWIQRALAALLGALGASFVVKGILG